MIYIDPVITARRMALKGTHTVTPEQIDAWYANQASANTTTDTPARRVQAVANPHNTAGHSPHSGSANRYHTQENTPMVRVTYLDGEVDEWPGDAVWRQHEGMVHVYGPEAWGRRDRIASIPMTSIRKIEGPAQ